jgi:hypothetical protein
MSTYDRAVRILTETIPNVWQLEAQAQAEKLIDALMAQRLTIVVRKASDEMFRRFHSHCAFVGEATGEGYEAMYQGAVQYAMGLEAWPWKLVVTTATVGDEEIAVDVRIPESTTKATNKQLLCAYEYITGVADEHALVLPERKTT